MKVLKIVIFFVIVIGVCLVVLRVRLGDYPINMTLTNVDGEALSVTIVGRSDRNVQFQKAGGGQVFDFPMAKLDVVSNVKLAFLPKTTNGKMVQSQYMGGGFTSSESEVSNLHYTGMQEQMDEFNVQLELLIAKYRTKTTAVERGHVLHEIRTLEIDINELQYKMELHQAHRK
ncbi:MAG: hypothetical protein ACSHX8_08680 [Opitutaceae bacterium]